MMAHLLDLLCWLVFLYLANMFVTALQNLQPGLMQILYPFFSVMVTFSYFGYFILFEGLWNGQTPGKFALGIRVRMADGTPITLLASFYRNLFRLADFMPAIYFLGLVLSFLTEKSQRLGDIVANTMVTHERIPAPKFAPAPHAFGVHPFEDHVGTLRRMSMNEYLAIKRLADRFPELPSPVQDRLLVEVWVPFAEKHGIKPLDNVHPVYLMEAAVMKYARLHDLM